MKYIYTILISLLGMLSAKANLCDTVPTGAPQLFGGKLYEFKNYVSIDSILFLRGGDTLRPYYPALQFKSSDTSWYGFDMNSWKRFLNSRDTINYLATKYDITNGASLGARGIGQAFLANFVGTNVDSIDDLTIIPADGSTTIIKDSIGLELRRTSNSTNIWDNRIIIAPYGQTWTNTFVNTIEVVANFDPSSTIRSIGIGSSVTGDNQLATSINYFGFALKLGATSATSGFQGISSTSNYYSNRFFTGLKWQKGDVFQLRVEEKDRNKFLIIVVNLNNGSTVSGYLNLGLPNANNVNSNYTIDSGYPSIFFDGGDFTVRKYTFDPLASGIQLVFVSNSIGYGYDLDSSEINNNYYTYYNMIKDKIPVKSVLLGKSGATTADVFLGIREILSYKPKYVVIDGIQTNDYFVYAGHDTLPSQRAYDSLVKKLKANGINVIHIVPAPRGINFPSYGTFQRDLKNWILRTYPNDIIVNDFDTLLRPGTPNSLDGQYWTYGDGTHLNVAGHAVRARAFLRTVQFEFYKGSTTRVNADTIVTKWVGVNNITSLPAWPVDVTGQLKTDTVHGGLPGDSLIIRSNSGGNGNIWFGNFIKMREAGGTLGIGTYFTHGSNNPSSTIHVAHSNTSTFEAGVWIENKSNLSGAKSRLFLQNDTLDNGQFYLDRSGATAIFQHGVVISQSSPVSGAGGIAIAPFTGGSIYFAKNVPVPGINVLLTCSTITGNVGIGAGFTNPTAKLHIIGGTTAAGTAPLKLTAGVNLTTPEDGAIEYDGTNYYSTVSTTRYILTRTLVNTATLDFPSTNAGTSSELTITVTGAAVGDPVSIGLPSSPNANSSFTGYVSATNTVTIRFNNYSSGAIDPASASFKASVLKY